MVSRRFRSALVFLALALGSVSASAQGTAREFRFEVRDAKKKPVPLAHISFFTTGDTVITDSSGIARISVVADSAVVITVRKLGYEPRNARFVIGTAPAFNIRVALGEQGQRLPEVEVKDDYPGEPWRPGYLQRKKRGGGLFRDASYFPGGQPFTLNDWFNGLSGIRTGGGTGGDISFPRCQTPGVWIDNQHATNAGQGTRAALTSVPAQDIAAIEVYLNNPPPQFQGQYEDCSILIWTRLR
jgi:hypothetical protein